MKTARRPAALVAGLVALALAVTGCSASRTPADLTHVISLSPVVPAGMVSGAAAVPSSPGGANNCGDPTASLAPNAPLPTPGQMPANSTMQTIYKRGYLVAGVDQSTYLWGYLNPMTKQLEGFDIDVVHAIAKAIFGDPNRVQFRAITSGQRVGALTGDQTDPQVDVVVRTFTVSCQRVQQGVLFSSVYYNAQERLLVTKDSNVASIDDLGGKRVCAAVGSDSLPRIAAVPSHPIPVAVGDWSDCLVMLQQGQVDAIATDDAILAGMAAQDPNTKVVGPSLAAEPYGIGMRRASPDFVRFVNSVLESFRANGWQQSYQTWLAGRLGPAGPPQATYSD
ncbi:MAG TPA: glutamate ABC transporter substrate-binding protein [Pseudonocardiaceae bacterium]|nr:glutamate ABC transporter substrate-binding protein [Pseudonocardiaceae bacterium]